VAIHHPDRVEKVVYLDTSFVADLVAELMKDLPKPTPREHDPAELASRASVAALIARGVGGPFPEHEIDETLEFDPETGRYLRDRVRPDARDRVKEAAAKVDFAAVRAPVLYMYAGGNPLPERAEDDPHFSKLTPAQQEKMRAMLPRMRQREDEAARMPGWKTVKVEHAKHYLWITNREEVLREMKGFLGM
jgi:pimeloyl-ACP methyl ester carboxylesterase